MEDSTEVKTLSKFERSFIKHKVDKMMSKENLKASLPHWSSVKNMSKSPKKVAYSMVIYPFIKGRKRAYPGRLERRPSKNYSKEPQAIKWKRKRVNGRYRVVHLGEDEIDNFLKFKFSQRMGKTGDFQKNGGWSDLLYRVKKEKNRKTVDLNEDSKLAVRPRKRQIEKDKHKGSQKLRVNRSVDFKGKLGQNNKFGLHRKNKSYVVKKVSDEKTRNACQKFVKEESEIEIFKGKNLEIYEMPEKKELDLIRDDDNLANIFAKRRERVSKILSLRKKFFSKNAKKILKVDEILNKDNQTDRALARALDRHRSLDFQIRSKHKIKFEKSRIKFK